jgi:hypothetical protein
MVVASRPWWWPLAHDRAALGASGQAGNMPRMLPWPYPDDGVQLPVEDLAMRVLDRMVGEGGLHGRDRITRADEDRYWGAYRQPGSNEPRPKIGHREWEQALSVAVDWLYVNGLIA